jgi:hypothetical protein
MKNKYSLAADLLNVLDPVRFARDKLKFEPDSWQAEALRSTSRALMLNCCRQSGKSTVAAIMAVHRVLYYPKSLVLLVSPSQRQSSELFKKATDSLNALTNPPNRMEDNRLSILFASGSRLVSLPGNETTVRGFSSPDVVIIDEAARVPDDLYFAIRPMLAVSGGQIIMLSTPAGKRGFFHREWMNKSTADKVLLKANDCPRITPAFLAEEKAVLGQLFYSQEYECEFIENENAVFTFDLTTAAFDTELSAWAI